MVITGNGFVVGVVGVVGAACGVVVVVMTGRVGVVVVAAAAKPAAGTTTGAAVGVTTGAAVVVVASTIGANTNAAGAGVSAPPEDVAPDPELDALTTGAPEEATAPRTAARTAA